MKNVLLVFVGLILHSSLSIGAPAKVTEIKLPDRDPDYTCENNWIVGHQMYYSVRLWIEEQQFQSFERLAGIFPSMEVKGTFSSEPNGENRSIFELSSKMIRMPGTQEKEQPYAKQLKRCPHTLPYTYTTFYFHHEKKVGLLHWSRNLSLPLGGAPRHPYAPRSLECHEGW